jgi:adenosyl cobinamide kinase/adenosyl cobinamide phosphate guanylyltransferase
VIFLFGPLWSGKRAVARELFPNADMVCDVQELARSREDLDALADELARHEVVIATEVGGGVVPTDAQERAARERAGRLSCLLAARADVVARVFCGIPKVIKGELP